jgi:uncharacterized protein YgbK (DUF1537 family)
MRQWLVSADDRTGALETAAEIAVHAGPVLVTVGFPAHGPCVVDLRTRLEVPSTAASRASALPVARWNAHKLDSTLRGNWVHEVQARAAATGQRVLLIPAWPAVGRTCTGGVVHVHGAPLAALREHLPEATLLPSLVSLEEWLAGGAPVGVADVADTESMVAVAAMAAAAAGSDVLIAGPAGPIGAVFAARFGASLTGVRASAPSRVEGPVLVVCGSATALSHEQVHRFRAARPDAVVLLAPEAHQELHPAVAAELAVQARARFVDARTVVIIGGDTAAAVLGDAPRFVGGAVQPGMPWSRDASGGGPMVITKAGAFGDVDSLVRLAALVHPPD